MSTSKNQSKEEKAKPENFSLIVISKKTLQIGDKDKVLINTKNMNEGPEYLTIFVDKEKETELLAGVDTEKGSKIQVYAYLNISEKENGGKKFVNNNLSLAGKPKQIIDQELKLKGFVVKSQGVATIQGEGYDPYDKLTFTMGVEVPGQPTAYYTVSANEKYFDSSTTLEKGDEVLVQGYLNTEPWKTETSQGVNQVIKVNTTIVVGEEKIQEHIKKNQNATAQSQKR